MTPNPYLSPLARPCHSSHSASSAALAGQSYGASTPLAAADPWPMPQPTASGRRPPPRIFRRERLVTEPDRLSYAEAPSRGTRVEALMLSRELAGAPRSPGFDAAPLSPGGHARIWQCMTCGPPATAALNMAKEATTAKAEVEARLAAAEASDQAATAEVKTVAVDVSLGSESPLP